MGDSRGESIPVFHPEFGRFMLEATPGKPWGIGFKDLLDVEPNMKWRSVNITILVDLCIGADTPAGERLRKTTWSLANAQSRSPRFLD